MGDFQGRSHLGAAVLFLVPFALAGLALRDHDWVAVLPAIGLFALNYATPGTAARRRAYYLFGALVVMDVVWSVPNVMAHGRGATIIYLVGITGMAVLVWLKYPQLRRHEAKRAAEIAALSESGPAEPNG